MPPSRLVPRIALLTVLAAFPAWAQQAAVAPEPVSFLAELLSIVLPLAFIILVLVAVLRFARRRYGTTGKDAPMSVVQILPLGPRERVVLIKTRTRRLFAVGVTAHSVRLITDLDPADLVVKASANPTEVGPANTPPAGASTVFGLPLMRRDPAGGRDRDPRPDR